MPLTLTRTIRFTATHRMFRPGLSAEANRREFGAVADWHPHDYECAVTVAGAADPSGMILDLAALDRLLREEITARLHGRLNELPEFSGGRPLPTCEALASHLFERLARRLPAGVTLDSVRVAEDATLSAERRRDA